LGLEGNSSFAGVTNKYKNKRVKEVCTSRSIGVPMAAYDNELLVLIADLKLLWSARPGGRS
jgi:hypothetical protein